MIRMNKDDKKNKELIEKYGEIARKISKIADKSKSESESMKNKDTKTSNLPDMDNR